MSSLNESYSNVRPNQTADGFESTLKSDSKLHEVGCCGDVPKMARTNKKRDKLLEWLKNSQLKREENNRQVFSRWIDMVDNGAIDLTSLTTYPGKSGKAAISYSSASVTNSACVLDSTACQVEMATSGSKGPMVAAKPVPEAVSTCQPMYAPAVNYYGNWFAANSQSQPAYGQYPSYQPPNNVGMFQGMGSYCPGNQMLPNYYHYVPVTPQCTFCPPYIVPASGGVVDPSFSTSQGMLPPSLVVNDAPPTVDIDVNKWFDLLNEIKITSNDKGETKNMALEPSGCTETGIDNQQIQ